MSFFALGIERLKIISNREWFGSAEVKFWSFASDEGWEFPKFESFQSLSETDRNLLVQKALKSVAQGWTSHEYQYVSDEQVITYGDTGVILYERENIPNRLHWTMFGLESDEQVRNLGAALDDFFTEDRVNSIAKAVLAVTATAASPVTAAALVLAKHSMQGVTTLLKGRGDDQIALIRQSFIRPLHFPTGTRHGVGVSSLLGNMWYDYFIYGIE